MTDILKLLEAGLTFEEIDEMSEWGTSIATEFDTEGGYYIAEKYLDAGMDEKAEELINAASKTITYWETLIKDLTGKNIYFEDETKHWKSADTGRYVSDPYTVIRQSDVGFNQAIIDKYG